MIHVLDVGRAAKYVCEKINEHHKNLKCVIIIIPYRSCSNKHEMISNISRFKNHENLVTACVTCISVVQDFNIPNAVVPVCRSLKKYSNIIILSTAISARIRLHEQILGRYMRYIIMDDLLDCIEKRKQLKTPLNRLLNFKYVIRQADCVVLGCSHFCIHEELIEIKLRQCGFQGSLINGVDEFVKHVKDIV